ncbi:hypothetical protein [Xanthomonas sp. LMG 12461]|uniref:hypothetical protein n=1 Tax=Xanthomonas sp. LMG 12461 TaxID=2014543 RepID=UPI00126403CE|nr:hypothetical protein [Xanthomonas sp. LMG 12461]KAB7765375.1 hypothetical protein CEK68_11780 [Xanthomonas sp. LMG 12461]
MTAPFAVDVLAVMKRALIMGLPLSRVDDMAAATAAVAELIDKAAEAEKVIRNAVAADEIHIAYEDYADDLRAALDRCGGAQ